MIPGPNSIYNCPNCQNLLSRGSIASGNTFRSKLYSDGRRISPMLPTLPNLSKCPKCNWIMWISKLKELGTTNWIDVHNKEWSNADEVQFLGIDDLMKAIEQGVTTNKEEELLVRQNIWWAFNNRVRKNDEMLPTEEEKTQWEKNAYQLMGLLNPEDLNQKIMLAELHRNLGHFDKCRAIIKSIEDENLNWVKEALLKECDKGNTYVVQLESN